MRERLVPLCTPPQLAVGLREPADLAGATLLHATAKRHEWLAWLRGASVPDLRGAREQLVDTVDMCVQSGAWAERGHRRRCAVHGPDRLG
jgi:LysR family glycine cleavage system transcriptional activator